MTRFEHSNGTVVISNLTEIGLDFPEGVDRNTLTAIVDDGTITQLNNFYTIPEIQEVEFCRPIIENCPIIKKVVLPGITNITPVAFCNDSVVSVELSSAISFAWNVSGHYGWNGAFGGCTSMSHLKFSSEMHIDDELTGAINGIFTGCTSLSSIEVTKSDNPRSLQLQVIKSQIDGNEDLPLSDFAEFLSTLTIYSNKDNYKFYILDLQFYTDIAYPESTDDYYYPYMNLYATNDKSYVGIQCGYSDYKYIQLPLTEITAWIGIDYSKAWILTRNNILKYLSYDISDNIFKSDFYTIHQIYTYYESDYDPSYQEEHILSIGNSCFEIYGDSITTDNMSNLQMTIDGINHLKHLGNRSFIGRKIVWDADVESIGDYAFDRREVYNENGDHIGTTGIEVMTSYDRFTNLKRLGEGALRGMLLYADDCDDGYISFPELTSAKSYALQYLSVYGLSPSEDPTDGISILLPKMSSMPMDLFVGAQESYNYYNYNEICSNVFSSIVYIDLSSLNKLTAPKTTIEPCHGKYFTIGAMSKLSVNVDNSQWHTNSEKNYIFNNDETIIEHFILPERISSIYSDSVISVNQSADIHVGYYQSGNRNWNISEISLPKLRTMFGLININEYRKFCIDFSNRIDDDIPKCTNKIYHSYNLGQILVPSQLYTDFVSSWSNRLDGVTIVNVRKYDSPLMDCSNIKDISLTRQITTISGKYTFSGCSSLTSLDFSHLSGIYDAGYNFKNNIQLNTLYFPELLEISANQLDIPLFKNTGISAITFDKISYINCMLSDTNICSITFTDKNHAQIAGMDYFPWGVLSVNNIYAGKSYVKNSIFSLADNVVSKTDNIGQYYKQTMIDRIILSSNSWVQDWEPLPPEQIPTYKTNIILSALFQGMAAREDIENVEFWLRNDYDGWVQYSFYTGLVIDKEKNLVTLNTELTSTAMFVPNKYKVICGKYTSNIATNIF